ncbi:P-loop containing nucleoside triphosphate hydrolase protein [Pisolithus thermaeus]|nr:P-loop containing nucleoside triphosphate hydrolase protein [Pisolithus croceorrhizus]KAI6164307.1 P-loop containing nucleoside triphosphate hydrolase protein [Pisolithus thermaeus]
MKRGANEDHYAAEKATAKKQRSSKTKGKQKQQNAEWPTYFHDASKFDFALNTVLAFVSSRKHLATTFPMVRSSVEGLLKRPLELAQVAELKALLPDLINFAYIARDQLRIQAETLSQVQRSGRTSPDFSLRSLEKSSSQLPGIEEDEHVLVLEFADNTRGKKQRTGSLLSLPPAMSAAQSKKLIESRDERFKMAVNELLSATLDGEDPVELLKAAARDHIPANPKARSHSPKAEGEVPSPNDRPSVNEVIQEIQEQHWYANQITDRRTFSARTAREGFLSRPLSASIQQALRDSRKITSFYTHQAAAINSICNKKHVIVSTSTASGKSVIYQVPVLRFLEEDPRATAMFVYPTKALAQDQRTALEQLLWSCPGLRHINVATYDGDTPQERRTAIRDGASVIFTNFDTIHASILPHEELWRNFLHNLRILAVDELHYYSDLMGSHVAQVIRRFRRVCAAVGNREVVFVSCSATITKPAKHMQRLFGVEEVEEITDDGAPSGCKDYLVWEPPYVDEHAPKLGRRSAMSEATRLMRFLMKRGIRVMLFCKIRKACELAMKTLRTELSAEGRLDILAKVMPYRGGYSQEDRRRIEHEAFSGNLLGIVATNALELGIDIGVLDAVIMLGFPFGLASFRQQAGRAGRRARDSMAVLVADMSPLDQHYVKYPDALYNNPIEDLVVHLDSKEIVEAHLQCAAYELPVSKDDTLFFGPLLSEICDKKLVKDEDGWYHTHPKYLPYPQKHVAIRGAEEAKYVVVDITKIQEGGQGTKILEELELSRALFEVYEGGVFMHQGLTFIVKEVSHDTRMAKVVRADVNWITSPRYEDVDAKQTYRIKEIPNSPHRLFFGRKRVAFRNKCILDVVDVDTPPWERQGTGLWLDVPQNTLGLLRSKGISPAAAIHSACHAWMNGFALAADLRTECKAAEKELKAAESRRKRPARLIFYESLGNSGVTAQAFDHASEILKKAQHTVESCPCEEGCANCILSPACREHNTISSKIGALVVLRGLLNLEIDVDGIPTQINEFDAADTIVEADFVRPIDGVEVEAA